MTSDAARRWARRLLLLVTGVPFLVTAAVVAALAVAYTLAGFLLVPRLITTYVPRYAEEQLKRRAEIGEVRFNPLLFKLEIRHLRLQEADGRPLLAFDRLFVDFEVSSLFRAAWTFAEIQLEAPRLDVVLARDGRVNVAELLDAFPRSEPAPRPAATAPPRVLLEHAVVRRGGLTFTDLSGRTPQTAGVEPINVELRNITTLPERRGPYAISATLTDGGVVGWDGEVSLLPLGSTGRLGIRGFPLATAWRFAQEDVTLGEPSGRVDADMRYQLAYRDGAASLKVEGIEVGVAGLVLTRRGDTAPLLALEKIRLTGGRGDLISRELTVPEISVSRGRLAATMARDGTVNWQTLVVTPPAAAAAPAARATPAPAAAPPAATPDARPWRLAVEKVRVEEVALSFTDQSRAAPLEVDVAGLTLDLSARLESVPAGLAGTAEGVGLKLARVAVREAAAAKTPLVSLEQISVEGGRIDLRGRQVAVSRVAVTGGATSVVRAADGSLPLVTMLGPADQGKPARPSAPAPAPARPAPAAAAKPWTVAVGTLDLADHRLAVADRSVTPAVELQIDGIKASVRELRSDGKKPIPFDASFRVAQGGRFTARGRVAPDGRAAEATLTVAQLALTPAQPYIARNTAVELRAGEVSTTGRLTYRAGSDRAVVTYTGSADIDRLLVVEAASGDPVLAWKSLHAETLRFGLAPDRLQIDEVRLAELDGNLVIFKDKSLNLARLMKPPGAPPDTPPAGGPAAAAAPAAPSAAPPTPAGPPPAPAAGGDAAPRFPVVVERVRLEQSSMNFADLSLLLPFATRVHALSGVVAGVGSDTASRATVKLDGRVDEFGLVKVDGSLSPFHPKVFTDITVIFRNVPMSPLTPYSATFAGRRIVAGTMNLDLEYKIDRSALVGENKVVLQQLQLGELVESPGAMRLPLDLAIAILSDSQGRIDIALPVRGNVDHPEFSYGHVIWQALVTVITKVVTSPFRALAGLVGGADSESLEAIAFEAGSDTVRPPERQKLQRVAEVLGKRPRLKLTVHGGYEAKVDGEALRSLRVRRDLAQRLGVKLNPGEDPGPVAVDHAKTQRALEALYTERGGAKAVEEFQAGYEKATGKKAQRANPVLALVDRGSPDRAFYEALFRRLVETAPLADAELTALGRRRAEAAARALKEGAGTAGARVEVGDTEAAGRAERNAVSTRLELGAAGS
jgi:uncharacterized protein involved in outer membrane biogenesis